MAERIVMTALSPTMEEGTILKWEKKEGDSVSAGDVLCEVETDKASMEYESTQEGTLLKIVLPENESAKVGDTIAVIGEEGEEISELLEAEAPKAEERDSGKDDGKREAAQPEPEPEPEREAPQPTPDEQKQPPAAAEPAASSEASPTAGGDRVKSSPLARKLAARRGIDISLVAGSGPHGRVTKRDVENFRGAPTAPAAAASAPVSGGVSAALPSEDQKIPLGNRRKVIAQRLSESKFSAPHFYLKVSADMEQVMSARKILNAALPEKAGVNAFFMKFAAEAIKRHPVVNSSWQGDHILQHGSIDIGLAVDAGNGLITPVVRNCGNRGIVDIDGELKVLIEKAKNNELKPEEYTGATFTISNLGSFGIEEFTAIINPPGSAILALGKTTETPVVDGSGAIVARPIMKMTLSCDHRVIDGAAGARFLSDLKSIMENPVRVLY
ncbi:MAG: pyruvate dehydrogenase complex dihydrolipoamide acetyltransferase [Alkalispirochaetaceae bacterium]